MANNQYVLRKIGQPTSAAGIFNLVPYKGDDPIPNESNYAIYDGICYSTFSYNSGNYIPIENMNTAISLGKNYAVYIEFGIGGAYPQVTGAKIKSTKVGGEAIQQNQTQDWVDYPDFYRIRPFDKTEKKNGETVVTQIIDGKKQEKCYLMLGKCVDKIEEYDKNYKFMPVSSLVNKWSGYYIQYVDTNIILMGSNVSGVPVLFPMPFFGGPGTSDKNQLKK